MEGHKTRQQTNSKQAVWFAYYYLLGPKRSLESLRDFGTEMGQKIGLNTLKRYSSEFDWQEKVKEIDARFVEQNTEQLLSTVEEMNTAHIDLASRMRKLAKLSVEQGIPLMARDGMMRGSDLAKLAREAVNIERLAMGEATERVELVENLRRVIIIDVGNLFKNVNDIPDPNDRLQKFAEGCDEIIEGHVKAIE